MDAFIRRFDELTRHDVKLAGGKGVPLGEMTASAFQLMTPFDKPTENRYIDLRDMIKIIKLPLKAHFWLKTSPKDKRICGFCSSCFFGISALLISVLIAPPVYDYISAIINFSSKYIILIACISLISLKSIFFSAAKVFEIITEQRIEFPPRYAVLFSAFSVPFITFAHQIIFVPFIKNYEQKNQPSR